MTSDDGLVPAPTELKTPGLRRRMACWMYEGVLLFGVVFLADYLFSTLSQTRNALDHRQGQQAFLFLILGIYFVWFWHKGQTLAMKTWRIRVLDQHGVALTQALALKRFVLSCLWFAPPLLLAWLVDLPAMTTLALCGAWVIGWAWSSRFAPQRQFWHDAWAGTQLVHEPVPD